MTKKEKQEELPDKRDFFTELMFGKAHVPEETDSLVPADRIPADSQVKEMSPGSGETGRHQEGQTLFSWLPQFVQENRHFSDDPFSFVLPAATRSAEPSNKTLHHLQQFLENVNYVELVENVDRFLKAVKQLKPVFNDIQSLLNSWQKK
ncbi:MAG: hypothetical protein LOD92_08035 [Bacillales bacterium]